MSLLWLWTVAQAGPLAVGGVVVDEGDDAEGLDLLQPAIVIATGDEWFLAVAVSQGDGALVWLADVDGDRDADLSVWWEGGEASVRLAAGDGPGWEALGAWTPVAVDATFDGLSLRVPAAAFAAAAGVGVDAGVSWGVVVVRDGAPTDVYGCADLCALDLGFDALAADADQDGLLLDDERAALTLPEDADTDDDGVPDGVDPDPLTCDADHDGLLDPVELGFVSPHAQTDPTGCFVADADPATTTNPRDDDSDDGGLADNREDRDLNGAVGDQETNPADPGDDRDVDGDSVADVLEGDADPDGDGVPARLDTDADNDGIGDRDELRTIGDDGVPMYLDADSDGDGLVDGVDGWEDPDGDGLIAMLDVDADGDTIPDGVEGFEDLDGDDVPNHLDRNADGDRRSDADEATGDRDCDGVADHLDGDDDDSLCETPPEGTVDSAPFDDPFAPPTPATVGGCDVAPAGMSSLWVGLLWLRRRRSAS